MTAVPIYGGPLKRDLIQMAYEECGQAGYEFEIEPEEYAYALRRLDALMAQWQARGIDLGYAFPDTGPASAQEESGIPASATNTVALALAMSLAPGIGKTMPQEARARLAQGMALLPRQAPQPMQLGRQTICGAGNRWGIGWRDPFFPVAPTVTPIAAVAALPNGSVEPAPQPSPVLTIFNTFTNSDAAGSDVDGFAVMAEIVADQLTALGKPFTINPALPCSQTIALLVVAFNAFPGVAFTANPSDLLEQTFERMLSLLTNLVPLPPVNIYPGFNAASNVVFLGAAL